MLRVIFWVVPRRVVPPQLNFIISLTSYPHPYEYGTDKVLRNVGYETPHAGEQPKRLHATNNKSLTTPLLPLCLKTCHDVSTSLVPSPPTLCNKSIDATYIYTSRIPYLSDVLGLFRSIHSYRPNLPIQ
jgi:hypothetical protein